MEKVSEYITKKLRVRYRDRKQGERPHGLIAMAETAIPQDVEVYLNDEDLLDELRLHPKEIAAIRDFVEKDGRRVRGQTPDELRTGSLKVVSGVLEEAIQDMANNDPESYWRKFRVVTNEPRHLIRSIGPSVSDVVFAQRLGTLAVDNALAGYTDFMVSQWLTEFVLVPLKLVVLGRKRVPEDGIFWKSVLAKTGQPATLV
jgi:6-phosphofructokinase